MVYNTRTKHRCLMTMRAWRIVLIVAFTTGSMPAFAQSPADYAVPLSSSVATSPPMIRLEWPAASATGYTIHRKLPDASAWTTITSLTSSATHFEDFDVSVGAELEYRVTRTSASVTAYGYALCGIEAPLRDPRGTVLLVVDRAHEAALTTELAQLRDDLMGDGWRLLELPVSATDAVSAVKVAIQSACDAASNTVTTLFLLGHVPVPLSGNISPDGHADHRGAWVADTFYGDLDGTWTDSTVSNNVANDPRNRNVPGDGKYDQSYVPSDLELEVGRVDLSNLPAFGVTETELLRRYLDKNHRFRHGLLTAPSRCLIDDNFGTFSGEAFAQNGWRNGNILVGAENVAALDWTGTLATEAYLWAYGCGGGWYTSCSGVATSSDFAGEDFRAIFTMLFGSYFGDWESSAGHFTQNSLMRAALASGDILTCAWAGRPHWFFHHMGLGRHIGYSTRATQNGSGSRYPPSNFGARQVHVSLMGDPTLRQHVVSPPSNLVAQLVADPGASLRFDLTWDASADETAAYRVYRSEGSDGDLALLAEVPPTQTEFTDPAPHANHRYLVRSVALVSTRSGSYFDASQGAFATFTSSQPLTRYVSPGGAQVWPFTNSPTAARDIQTAIDAALPGDEVLVAGAFYGVTNALRIDRAISVRGLRRPHPPIIDAGGRAPCLLLQDPGATVEGFVLTGGSSADGGGAHITAGKLVNGLVISNQASARGGGVYIEGDGRIVYCTVVDNSADGEAGGVYAQDGAAIVNSIVADNAAPSNQNWASSGTPTFVNTCSLPQPPGRANVLFSETWWDYSAHRPAPPSPCIDGGTVSTDSSFDLDGMPRPLDGNANGSATPDIGAYEYANPGVDGDGDGASDAAEYAADTDPLDTGSVFRITAVMPEDAGWRLEWTGGVMATQYVEWTAALVETNAAWSGVFTNPPPTPVTNSRLLESGSSTATGGFIRLRATRH